MNQSVWRWGSKWGKVCMEGSKRWGMVSCSLMCGGSFSILPTRKCVVWTGFWNTENIGDQKHAFRGMYSLAMPRTALIYSASSSWRVKLCAVISACQPCCIWPLFLVCVVLFSASAAQLPSLAFNTVSGALSFQYHSSYPVRSTCREGADSLLASHRYNSQTQNWKFSAATKTCQNQAEFI